MDDQQITSPSTNAISTLGNALKQGSSGGNFLKVPGKNSFGNVSSGNNLIKKTNILLLKFKKKIKRVFTHNNIFTKNRFPNIQISKKL